MAMVVVVAVERQQRRRIPSSSSRLSSCSLALAAPTSPLRLPLSSLRRPRASLHSSPVRLSSWCSLAARAELLVIQPLARDGYVCDRSLVRLPIKHTNTHRSLPPSRGIREQQRQQRYTANRCRHGCVAATVHVALVPRTQAVQGPCSSHARCLLACLAAALLTRVRPLGATAPPARYEAVSTSQSRCSRDSRFRGGVCQWSQGPLSGARRRRRRRKHHDARTLADSSALPYTNRAVQRTTRVQPTGVA